MLYIKAFITIFNEASVDDITSVVGKLIEGNILVIDEALPYVRFLYIGTRIGLVHFQITASQQFTAEIIIKPYIHPVFGEGFKFQVDVIDVSRIGITIQDKDIYYMHKYNTYPRIDQYVADDGEMFNIPMRPLLAIEY